MPLRHHNLETDVLVAGGGMAGVCAALAAARHGASVILVQDRGVLGGNASGEVRMHIVGADCHGARKGWRESGILEELRLTDAVRNPQRSFSQWELLLYEAVLAESRITMLLDTCCVGVEMQPGWQRAKDPPRTGRLYEYEGAPGRIRAVNAVRECTQDAFRIEAKLFIDCTGDGRLGYEAGADFRVGREPRALHGETLAGIEGDDHTLGSSILFTGRKHDQPVPFVPPPWARRFPKSGVGRGRGVEGFEYGYWWIEWGGHLDTLSDHATRIRHELYAIALGVWDHVKNSGHYPESANWALDWVGPIPGKRESRRLLGPHILTQQDLQAGSHFPDGVAYGGWAIDLHPPLGVDDPGPPFTPHALKGPYGIPFRSLYSRNVENLLMAGRNLSATHWALASTRVMGTCAVEGQAVGTAAALMVRENLSSPADLSADAARVSELQQALLRDDVTLLGVAAKDPADQARTSEVTASSHLAGYPPILVLDGLNRDEMDPKSGQVTAAHHWSSSPAARGEQWIELRWPAPVRVTRLELTFDTGFQRPLALTASDNRSFWGVRGPQPETVRDYRVELDDVQVLTIGGNVQRKRVHPLDGRAAWRLRIICERSHGVPEARLFEVRVY
ncbi:MAG TPA: FAD-dependent oxidoreductase [Armatimonadota bacterium]